MPLTLPLLRGELALLEELAREENFRPPQLDETLEEYERALRAHLDALFAKSP